MSLDLHDLAQRIMAAETPADGAEILREAIEQLIKECKPNIKYHACRFNDGDCVCDCYKIGQDQYQSNLLASIKPRLFGMEVATKDWMPDDKIGFIKPKGDK